MLTVEQVAEVAHNLNKSYCEAIGETDQTTWAETPELIQGSTIDGVKEHIANPAMTPEESHAAWLADKTADGWKFGESKVAGDKEHPCMVPWAELSTEWKAKDHLFKTCVDCLTPFMEPAATPEPTPEPTAEPVNEVKI